MIIIDVIHLGLPVLLLLSDPMEMIWNAPNFLIPVLSVGAVVIGLCKPFYGSIMHFVVLVLNILTLVYTFIVLYDIFNLRDILKITTNIWITNQADLESFFGISLPVWYIFVALNSLSFIFTGILSFESFLRGYKDFIQCLRIGDVD